MGLSIQNFERLVFCATAFTGLRLDVDKLRKDNESRTDVTRKNGMIINTGGMVGWAHPVQDLLQPEILS